MLTSPVKAYAQLTLQHKSLPSHPRFFAPPLSVANCQGGPVRWAPTSQPAGLVRTGRTQATAADSVVSVAAGAIFGEGWPLWASVFGCAAIGHLAEEHTWIGEKLSAPLVSMLFAVALSATGIIPADCTSYNVVWKYMMPMAASCFLLNTDLGKLASTGGATMAAFLVGSVGMMLGAVIGWWAFRHQLGPEGGKLAAALCSSYVGGSVNFCAVATAVNLDPIVIPAAMAADNLAMAAYLAVLMAVPTDTPGATLVKTSSTSGIDLQAEQNQLIKLSASSTSTSEPSTSMGTSEPSSSTSTSEPSSSMSTSEPSSSMGTSEPSTSTSTSEPSTSMGTSTITPSTEPPITSGSLVMCVTIASVSNALAQALAALWQIQHLTLLLMSVLTIALSSSLRHLSTMSSQGQEGLDSGDAVFAGGPALGGGLMLIFFAIIGASAGSLSGLSLTWTLMGFMTVMVLVHWVVLIVGTTALGLPRNAVLLGSNACIGGPATATAMAQSKGWHHMVSPALLTGSLGYGIGTAAGLLVVKVTAQLAAAC